MAPRIAVPVLCAALVAAAGARADAFCDHVRNEAAVSPRDGEIRLPQTGQGALNCRSSLGLGGARAVHCSWPFAYRAPQARAAFEEAVEAVKSCLGGQAARDQDGLVNHPDSYDLRVFPTASGSVAVSLKDKGALQQTLVFLRVEVLP